MSVGGCSTMRRLPSTSAVSLGSSWTASWWAVDLTVPSIIARARLVDEGEDPGGIDARVVHVDRAHRRVARHAIAIGAHRAVDDVPGVVADHADLPAGDDEARREALQVELEWPGQGLVEVVDVEEQVALRRREQAEVRRGARRRRAGP